MKVLYTAFNGKTNSSKILLDKVTYGDKLYLKNSFKTSVLQLIDKIKDNHYDLIVSFGQSPIEKDIIKIETTAKLDNVYETNYDYSKLKDKIKQKFKVVISNNAGNYLCNNIYYYGLKYISENKLETKMIFIHIPKIRNINNIDALASIFNFSK